jgi:hypothetical protein
MLREFVIKLLGSEKGADEVLRRAWDRLEAMPLPPGQDSRATLLVLAESEVRKLKGETSAPKTPPAKSDQDDIPPFLAKLMQETKARKEGEARKALESQDELARWLPPSSIDWTPIDIDGVECLIGCVDGVERYADRPWTILRHGYEIGIGPTEYEAIEKAHNSLGQVPWFSGPKPVRMGPIDLPPPPPRAEKFDSAVLHMSADEYCDEVGVEIVRLLGLARADESADLWGEVFLAHFCEQSYLRGISVASCAHTWAMSMPIYEQPVLKKSAHQ